ncbi:ATP-binding protein [Prosthecobacter sp.]|uniref:ATP-binding protein n=1 Tax=Prosthecobacter sp. TaxID=1965333 RepID=UPI0037844ADD
MNTEDMETILLTTVPIRTEPDIVTCRQQARHLASTLGFDTQTQVRIATSVSEIVRNAYQYAGGGKAVFSVETDTSGRLRHNLRRQTLVIDVQDQGPGIGNLGVVLSGNYKSATGLGLGILGARRLMDEVEIDTSATGSRVTLRKNLAPNLPRKTPQELRALAATMVPEEEAKPASVMSEVQQQNKELLAVMEEISHRQDDLTRMNKELEETNAGVLALYDELDTLHRVGLLLASKMDLPAVMHALITATTELTSAEISTCYLCGTETTRWERYANAGRRAEVLEQLPETQAADFFGEGLGEKGMVHIPDFALEEGRNCMTQFAEALAPRYALRSCLAVELKDADGKMLGVLIFGSEEPGIFTERSERIVVSISAQATIAIDNARLFDSVKAASEAKDKFLAMISHELRTPLNPVLSIISGLHENPALPEVFREDIAVVLRNIQLETRLIDDLLDFHRIIKGNLSFATEPVDMHAMVRNVIEICRADVEQRGHRLRVNLNAKRSVVEGDPARLQQVLWNILKNAIKFTPPGGSIEVTTSVENEDTLLITMKDNGRGIEAEMLGSIFSAFEQGSVQGLTSFGGLGLGLAIVKTFVLKHGGTVEAQSPGRDQGSTLLVRVPLAAATEVEDAGAGAGAAGSMQQPLTTGRVLLIDDHADTLWSLNRLLLRRGYEVTMASSCAEAVTLAKEGTYDVIISDLGLPDGSGVDLLKEIRQFSDVPAIALSGYGMESDMTQTKEAGFATHLTKPVDFQVLTEAVRGLMKAERAR